MSERDIRYRAVVPPEKMSKCRCVIAGVGAIGRQVALQLAAMGAPKLILFDFDKVEEANLGTQGWCHFDIGSSKVEAAHRSCAALNPRMEVEKHECRFDANKAIPDGGAFSDIAVFACVDKMSARKTVWETLGSRSGFFVDGRMAAETCRVVTGGDHYSKTLFDDREAYQGACTSKATIYAASVAAGLMIAQFTKWLRAMPADADVSLNLLAVELAVD